MKQINVAVLGARGYVGFELIKLIDYHPHLKLVVASSRQYFGQKVYEIVDGFSDQSLRYCADGLLDVVGRNIDVLFLALPNGVARKQKALLQSWSKKICIIDLSADFRFDHQWLYSQPETCQKTIIGARCIANPGCYATAAQLGILPMVSYLNERPSIFGISGFSGAGSQASDKNDPNRLRDNVQAYQLVNHIHEKEVSDVLGIEVSFMPHVADFFRGIHLTIHVSLNVLMTREQIRAVFSEHYRDCDYIHVIDDIPEVQRVQNTHDVCIGGFSVNNRQLVFCVVIDNLLKGAATQAIQNMNMALSDRYQLSMNTGLISLCEGQYLKEEKS